MSLQSSSEFWDATTFWLAGIGTILLFVSVITGIRARRLARLVTEQKNEQTAREKHQHDETIESLKRDVAEANAHGKEAEMHAAEANEKAEHERLERLKIERQIAPRAISPEQHKSIVDQLLAYRPDVPVGVFAGKQSAEIMSFSNSLMWALGEAKWPVSAGVKEDQYRAVVGILIEVRANADSQDWVRAEALAAILRGQQIDVFGPNVMEPSGGFSFRGSLDVIEMSPIHVIVGEKLLGP